MNTTFGPSGTNVANMGNTGFVGGLPMGPMPSYNGGFMSASPTTMSFGMPMQQAYNPYSYTGVANMGSPMMTMPMNRGSSL